MLNGMSKQLEQAQGEAVLLRERLGKAEAVAREGADDVDQAQRFGQQLAEELRAELALEQKGRARAEGSAVTAMKAQKAAAKAAVGNACEAVAISCLDFGLPLGTTTIRELVDLERNAGKLIRDGGSEALQQWLISEPAVVAENGVLAAVQRAERAEKRAEGATEAAAAGQAALKRKIAELEADLLEVRATK